MKKKGRRERKEKEGGRGSRIIQAT